MVEGFGHLSGLWVHKYMDDIVLIQSRSILICLQSMENPVLEYQIERIDLFLQLIGKCSNSHGDNIQSWLGKSFSLISNSHLGLLKYGVQIIHLDDYMESRTGKQYINQFNAIPLNNCWKKEPSFFLC